MNAHEITIEQVAENEGMSMIQLLETYGEESVVPACCDEGCQVEPDGKCPHGCPSILIKLGVI